MATATATLPSMVELQNKLMNARCRLAHRDAWYGHFSISMRWRPSDFSWQPEESARTMGVRIIHGGIIECLWYPGFVHSQSLEQLYVVVYHEIEHLVRSHCVRQNSSRNHKVWNIAADFCVNGKKSSPRIGYVHSGTTERILPLDGKCCFTPENWDDNSTAEQFYNKLMSDDPARVIEYGMMIDDHSVWQQSEVSQDEARQIIKDMCRRATDNNQGKAPDHLQGVISDLNKPIVRWRELLRRYVGTHVGSTRRTYSRRDRRHEAFGIKGISRHAASRVRVVVDTSGSVSSKELEQFFAEIDMLSSSTEVKVLQWDAGFQHYGVYRRGDWKKWPLKGRGGTDMIAPFIYLRDHHELGDCQILLTDGECQFIEPQPWFPELGMITVITRTDSGEPSWGHVVRLVLHQ